MSSDSNTTDTAIAGVDQSSLVTRSAVPPGKPYNEYRQNLRYDFFYSCAYCTISEAEAQAIRFAIDHYEPRKARPDLENEYANLMYSCDECNIRKGDRCPPPAARTDGFRFFRPDQDNYRDHFEKDGIRLKSKSAVGDFSIEALDLNRHTLLKLRQIRDRLTKCDQLVSEGVLSLRRFRIDQLPSNVKGPAVRAIRKMDEVANEIAEEIDSLLRDYARSELIDPDTDPESAERNEKRLEKLKKMEILYPGKWRHRDRKESTQKKHR